MRYINELRESDIVNEIYLCKQMQQLKTKNGKTYLSLTLQDKTGTLDAKIWDINSGIDNFEAMDYVFVSGPVNSFQGQLQLKVERLRHCKDGEYIIADYMPASEYDVDEMYKKLMGYYDKVVNEHLKALLKSFFVDDEDFIKKFKAHSAARSVHHGFIGGLLEHTLSVTGNCYFFAGKYSILSKDLLLTAAMFHDIGKLWELSSFPENEYTDAGNLLGHIMIGYEQISARIRTMPGFPEKLRNELLHCIAAHHGQLDYGSPKVPALAEAMALFFADNIDAKMETFKEIFDNSEEKADWLGYNKLLETNIRRTSI